MSKVVIYVAGPITAKTDQQRQHNIEQGRLIGIVIWKLGAVPIVPHLNSLGAEEGHVGTDSIYAGDLELLSRCDAMFRISPWRHSRGTCYETAWARYKKIPIITSLKMLKSWLASR